MTLYRSYYYFLETKPLISFLTLSQKQGSSTTLGNQFLNRNPWVNIRGFKEKRTPSLTPASVPSPSSSGAPSYKRLLKPLLFTVGFSSCTLVSCTIWQYETFRASAIRLTQANSWLPHGWAEQKKSGLWRQRCNEYWNQLSEAQKVFAPVLLVNILVFGAWRVPKLQPTMLKYFASNPAARVLCWPMILSVFSHYSFLHLAANMFVLHSFCPAIVGTFGKEQATALYLFAGVVSSFTSYLHKVIVSKPGLSVGASGAIMGILGFVCTQYPDTRLSIIFLPIFTFSAGVAIKVAVGVDLLGCLLGWKFFDHAAHLGGAVTGICWAHWGNTYIWQKCEPVIRMWHDRRRW